MSASDGVGHDRVVESLHADRGRAESFGAVADDYDRFRPTYAGAMMDDLAALGRRAASDGPDILDIGCGTGKAARQLRDRGRDVLGIDVDARMAEIARSHGILVEVGAFETWDDRGRRFDLITAAQSWHWVEPVAGADKAARLLRDGGSLAIFWNHLDPEEEPALLPEIAAVYAEHAPELSSKKLDREPTTAAQLTASGHFREVTTRDYPVQRSYTAHEWVGYVRTHSDHLALGPARLDALGAALHDAVEARGGRLDMHGATYVVRAVR